MHLAQPPAGDIKVFVIEAEVDVGDQRRHRAKAFEQVRQVVGIRRDGVDGDRLFRLPFAVFIAPPGKDRALQVGGVDHHAAEPVFPDRVVGGADFQRHLVVLAKVQRLDHLACAQIPEVDGVAVFVAQQVFGHDSVFELRRQAPFGTDHVVARQVPPEVIVLVLNAAVHLVAALNFEGLAVHDEDAGGAVGAILATAAKGRDIDAFGAAMDGVGAGIARLGHQLFGFDDLVDLEVHRILDVDDIDTGRADAGDDQVAPFKKGVAGQRRQGRGTGVPAEVVEFVAKVWHEQRIHDLTVGAGFRIHVDNGEAVGLAPVRAEHQRECQCLDRGLHGHLGRGVKCGVWSQIHNVLPDVWLNSVARPLAFLV